MTFSSYSLLISTRGDKKSQTRFPLYFSRALWRQTLERYLALFTTKFSAFNNSHSNHFKVPLCLCGKLLSQPITPEKAFFYKCKKEKMQQITKWVCSVMREKGLCEWGKKLLAWVESRPWGKDSDRGQILKELDDELSECTAMKKL